MDLNKPSTSYTQDIRSVLSNDPDTEGFDFQAGETWIYPTNYALREYQYNIIQEALLNNTMVSLPTGLGKTFIAAVVMYNFYRWYPSGKIIFMAPTRPLVKQQIDACYNIMAIPKDVTAELTGTKMQKIRKEIWKDKRVFFITPQILQNDLSILNELGNKIKCVVFDEAHKAKGNHAYCEVIRRLLPLNKSFRVLGLSATPGSSLQDVLEVIHNLLISHLEIRTDESPDVTPYIFQRTLETIVVPLDGKLQQVRSDYMQILEKYTRVLVQHKVISGNCSMLTKGKIFMTMKNYTEKNKNSRGGAYSEIMRHLNICITLYHGYELLIRHGLRGFLSFFEEHADKPILRGNNAELRAIMQDVAEHLGPAPNVEPLPDGSIPEIPESSKFGHPKFYKLRDVLTRHFNEINDSSSRVIVFCEYRESVMEAYALLLRHKPLIKPRIFMGQGAITQKQQISVIRAFKQGECNTLISTCIGEEGLDVGDVDLIVCFDINNKSPVRMVQRMGRTGRKRQGRIIVLVTEGKEQQTLKECLIHKENLTNHILQSSALYKQMYPRNPRMIPENIHPKCQKMFITVKAESEQTKGVNIKKNSNLKDMFDSISSKKSNASSILQNFDSSDIANIIDRIPSDRHEYFNKANPLNITSTKDDTKIDFTKKLAKLRTLQPTGQFGHSKDSHLLVSLLQFTESKKYNIPMSQVPATSSQMDQPIKSKLISSNGFRQTDIRNMFGKPMYTEGEILKDQSNTQEQTEESSRNKRFLKSLQTEISTYLALTLSDDTTCTVCDNLFDCSQFVTCSSSESTQEINLKSWIEPDKTIFDNINTENLTIFANSLSPKSNKLCNQLESVEKTPEKKIEREETSEYQKSENDVNPCVKYETSPFKPPNDLDRILKKCEISFNLSDSIFSNVKLTQLENLETNKINEGLSFFKLNSLEDIFGEHLSSPANDKNVLPLDDTIIYTPNTSKIDNMFNSGMKSCSPILSSSFDRTKNLKHKVQKRLFDDSTDQLNLKSSSNKPNLSKLLKISNNNEEKSLFCKSKMEVNEDEDKKKDIHEIIDDNTDESLPDVIDTSLENAFESVLCTQIAQKNIDNQNTNRNKNKEENKTQISNTKESKISVDALEDFCDDSLLGMLFVDDPFNEKTEGIKENKNEEQRNEDNKVIEQITNGDKWEEENIWDFFTDRNNYKEDKDTNKSENQRDVIDLTQEDPTKANLNALSVNKSPTLIKSQRYIFSQLKSQSSKLSQNCSGEPSQKNIKGPTKSKSKLQLTPKASVTSMNWFKSYNNSKKSLSAPNKSVINTKAKEHVIILEDDDEDEQNEKKESPTITKTQDNDIESDYDESFTFTFNRKKQASPTRPLSLSNKISPRNDKFTLKQQSNACKTPNKTNEDAKHYDGGFDDVESTPKRTRLTSKILNSPVDNNDSDNDFEMPKQTAVWLKKRPNILGLKKMQSPQEKSTIEKVNNKKTVKKKTGDCPFIDLEAEVSQTEIVISDSDDESTDNDKFEESFVDDETQNVANTTTMHAHYLKSVRSPLLNRGKFKIPEKPKRFMDVFSQQVSQTDNTYINDSFCVNPEDVEFQDSEDISELELAELILETEKNERRSRKKSDSDNDKKKLKAKRRRILQTSSSSDTD